MMLPGRYLRFVVADRLREAVVAARETTDPIRAREQRIRAQAFDEVYTQMVGMEIGTRGDI